MSKNCPKALGLPWDFENDVIHFNFEKKSHRLKSRHCLRENVVFENNVDALNDRFTDLDHDTVGETS